MERSRKKIRFCSLILLAAVLAAWTPVSAQRAKLFQLGRWGGALKFRYYAKKRQSPVVRKDHTFYEDFVLRNNGFIIHPKLFFFNITGDLRFFQEKIGEMYRRSKRGP
jgi:hypothetical protein